MMNLNLSKEDLQYIITTVYNKTDFAKKLGFKILNGKTLKIISNIISDNNLDDSHFDPSKKNKERKKYNLEIKFCPVCNLQFETLVGSKEERSTCGYSCSNVFFTSKRHTELSKFKTSSSMKKFYRSKGIAKKLLNKKCKNCQISFETFKKNKTFCSVSCSTSFNWSKPYYRNIHLNKIKDRIARGNHKGWRSRYKCKPSFPEKVTIEILSELNILLEKEYPQGKWFIDFADIDRKIAIEIDGKQHNYPDRKISDEKKDQYLIDKGWKVYRIKWKKLTKESRSELKEKLKLILI